MEYVDYSKYMVIPWKDGGRDWNGVDCWGLCLLFALEELNCELPYLNQYETCHNIQEIENIVNDLKARWARVDDPNIGDIVDLSLSKNNFHVGIVPVEGRILHIEENGFASMPKISEKRIKGRIKGFWRYSWLTL